MAAGEESHAESKVFKVSEKRRAQFLRTHQRIMVPAQQELALELEAMASDLGVPTNVKPPYNYDMETGEFKQPETPKPPDKKP